MKKILCSNWLAWQERWAYLNCPIGMSCMCWSRKKKSDKMLVLFFLLRFYRFRGPKHRKGYFYLSVQCAAMFVLLRHEFVFQYVLKNTSEDLEDLAYLKVKYHLAGFI